MFDLRLLHGAVELAEVVGVGFGDDAVISAQGAEGAGEELCCESCADDFCDACGELAWGVGGIDRFQRMVEGLCLVVEVEAADGDVRRDLLEEAAAPLSGVESVGVVDVDARGGSIVGGCAGMKGCVGD